jgi:hypothetical protein
MTEFTKTKTHFALAFIGTLFALHPILERNFDIGFEYQGYTLKLWYVYAAVISLLAFAVYCYGVALLSEKPSSRMERLGNFAYAVAIMTPPLYGMLYGASLLAEKLELEHLAWTAPAIGVGVIALWLLGSQFLAWRLRRQDNTAKIEQLAAQEMASLSRAREMFDQNHYDLAVIESWKALEARLRRALLKQGTIVPADKPKALIDAAKNALLVREPALSLLQDVRHQWTVAVGVEPVKKEAADAALTATRHILSTIAVDDPKKGNGK